MLPALAEASPAVAAITKSKEAALFWTITINIRINLNIHLTALRKLKKDMSQAQVD